jgi:hypothetical protein
LLPPFSSPPLSTTYRTLSKLCCNKTVSGKLMHHLVLPPRPLSRKSISFTWWLRQ